MMIVLIYYLIYYLKNIFEYYKILYNNALLIFDNAYDYNLIMYNMLLKPINNLISFI